MMRARFLFVLVLVFSATALAAESSDILDKTRVRVRPPVGTFHQTLKGVKLSAVEAKARNVGRVTAHGVVVSIRLPRGETVKLAGPSTLEPNEEALYTANPDVMVYSKKRLRGVAECENCRK